LSALLLGHVHADGVGLDDLHRLHRAVSCPVVPVHPGPAYDLHLRDAHHSSETRGGGRQMRRRTPTYGLLAEFKHEEDLVRAVYATRDAGYRRFDAYSPTPIEGLSEEMGFHDTGLPMLVLGGGIAGCLGGFFLQYYLSVINYPINIGGRPLNSWPSFIPITFE